MKDVHALAQFAVGLACGLRGGDIVALSGPVGAGKTTLVRALVPLLTGFDETSSPSFTFWQRYEGRIPVNHLDLYRIENEAELPMLGLEEAFDSASITLIEWPERARGLWSAPCLHLTLAGSGDEERLLTIERT